MNAFWSWQKQNSDFQFLAFPIAYKGVWVNGGVWRPTSFLKGIFVQEESSETRFYQWPNYLKLKPFFNINARPNKYEQIMACFKFVVFLWFVLNSLLCNQL